MAIEEFHSRSESRAVTYYTNRQFSFSVALVTEKGLDAFEYARLGVDSEYRRVYFAFHKTPAPGLVKFYKSDGHKRRMMAIGTLCSRYDWLDALRGMKDQADRQFVLEEVDPNNDVYAKFQYYITVGYTFSADKDINDKHNYPAESGVYRLKKDSEVVRIGEAGNMAVRLREHLKDYLGQIDAFDFEIVPNATERKAEQKRLLDSFKTSVGRLPKLNLVAN